MSISLATSPSRSGSNATVVRGGLQYAELTALFLPIKVMSSQTLMQRFIRRRVRQSLYVVVADDAGGTMRHVEQAVNTFPF
jgi:hypothetical protein